MRQLLDASSAETQRQCIDAVIARVADIEDPASVGVIAAQDIIDTVLESLGPGIYNAGLRDAKKVMQNHHTGIDYEIDALEQSTS